MVSSPARWVALFALCRNTEWAFQRLNQIICLENGREVFESNLTWLTKHKLVWFLLCSPLISPQRKCGRWLPPAPPPGSAGGGYHCYFLPHFWSLSVAVRALNTPRLNNSHLGILMPRAYCLSSLTTQINQVFRTVCLSSHCHHLETLSLAGTYYRDAPALIAGLLCCPRNHTSCSL